MKIRACTSGYWVTANTSSQRSDARCNLGNTGEPVGRAARSVALFQSIGISDELSAITQRQQSRHLGSPHFKRNGIRPLVCSNCSLQSTEQFLYLLLQLRLNLEERFRAAQDNVCSPSSQRQCDRYSIGSPVRTRLRSPFTDALRTRVLLDVLNKVASAIATNAVHRTNPRPQSSVENLRTGISGFFSKARQ